MGFRSSSYTQNSPGPTYQGITNIIADSVSRLKAVGLYHDIDLKDH